jgi:DNA-binding GntR family transcriptional regulator
MPSPKSDHAFDEDADGNKSTRSEWVYARLLRGIKAGQFSRGDRLREVDIAETLGVSRTPVREALFRCSKSCSRKPVKRPAVPLSS